MIDSHDATPDRAIATLRDQGGTALADLFVEHRDRLRRMVEVRLDRRAAGRIDPSDVLQETFIEASCRLGDYLDDPPMPPFLWLRFLTSQRLMAIHRRHLGVQKRTAAREVCLIQNSASSSLPAVAPIHMHTIHNSSVPQNQAKPRLAERLELKI